MASFLSDKLSAHLRPTVSEVSGCVPEDQIPDAARCAITREVMKNPVLIGDGFSYEESAIKKWLSKHNRSPITNAKLPSKRLLPNYTLRNIIKESGYLADDDASPYTRETLNQTGPTWLQKGKEALAATWRTGQQAMFTLRSPYAYGPLIGLTVGLCLSRILPEMSVEPTQLAAHESDAWQQVAHDLQKLCRGVINHTMEHLSQQDACSLIDALTLPSACKNGGAKISLCAKVIAEQLRLDPSPMLQQVAVNYQWKLAQSDGGKDSFSSAIGALIAILVPFTHFFNYVYDREERFRAQFREQQRQR